MKKNLKKMFDIFMKPEMMILPGQLAFFIILAIFPMLTLIGYLGSNISLFSHAFSSMMGSVLPKGIADVMVPFFHKQPYQWKYSILYDSWILSSFQWN